MRECTVRERVCRVQSRSEHSERESAEYEHSEIESAQ